MLPVVSIICCTYNHEPFIRQCLDGFMMQKTDFSFEVLIHDDASTDNTAEIIREYELKYPDKIFPIYATENKYSKGIDIFSQILLPKAKGKYIAICEGDDYWTDPLKLQKQVDFLERNQDYILCSHMCDRLDNETGEYKSNSSNQDITYSLSDLLNGEWYYQTLSVLFRRNSLSMNSIMKYEVVTDTVLIYELLRFGGYGMLFKDAMGVYRWHSSGVWSMISMNAMREQEFKVRFSIYKVVPNKESAILVLGIWKKALSRRWLIAHQSIMIKSILIFFHHFGILFTIRLLFEKLCCGREIEVNMLSK